MKVIPCPRGARRAVLPRSGARKFINLCNLFPNPFISVFINKPVLVYLFFFVGLMGLVILDKVLSVNN